MCCLFVVAGRSRSDDPPKPDLVLLLAEVRKLVEKHYPNAKFTLTDSRAQRAHQAIHFEFKTREFMIHELTRICDEWQGAHEGRGPQPGGIYCDIELRPGKYGGAAVVPRVFDKRYFTLLLMAPYSKKIDHHLYIQLKYPGQVSQEFLNKFKHLANGFDEHVSATGESGHDN
jgi:hypothetical protein